MALTNLIDDLVSKVNLAFGLVDKRLKSKADKSELLTDADVEQHLKTLVDNAPGSLDTLSKLAAAIDNNSEFSSTVADQLASKAAVANVYQKQQIDRQFVNKDDYQALADDVAGAFQQLATAFEQGAAKISQETPHDQ